MDTARRSEAIHRMRRIIINDDNGSIHSEDSNTIDNYLSDPVAYTPGTQVDSIWLSVMTAAELLVYNTEVGEIAGQHPYPAAPKADLHRLGVLWRNMKSFLDVGTDPLRIVVEYGHAHDMEVFASFRMNMIQDSWRRSTHTRWKREHPEYCLGVRGMFTYCEGNDPHKQYWSALDYTQPAVHDQRLAVFNEICTGYEVDGLELDFWRWPMLFKPSLDNLPVQPRQVEMMNNFMRRVRKRMLEIEDERDRPLLLAPRVFDTEEICLRMGLDVRTWLKEGLIDLLVVGGDYNYYSVPVAEWSELAHQHNVPMYPCMYRSQGLERDRALAQHYHYCGADGIYTFNYRFPKVVSAVNEIGDPQSIDRKDKLYVMSGSGNLKHVCAPPLVPIQLKQGCPQTAALLVGDDVQTAVVDDDLAELKLVLSLTHLSPEKDQITFNVNGRPLGKASGIQMDADVCQMSYLLYTVFTDIHREPPIVQGRNIIEITVERQSSTLRGPVTLVGVELSIKYQ